MNNNEMTLATELLKEIQTSAKRWFIIAMAELVAIVILVIMLFVVPTEETSTTWQDADASDTASITQTMNDGE